MDQLTTAIQTRGVAHKSAAPSLALHDVSVTYARGGNGRTTTNSQDFALKNISFQLSTGEHIAVVGPNGAGKSTLFKLIVGTIKPTTGEVSIFGHTPGGHICIAYVPQRSQIDWSFPVTVEDVVMMGRVGQIGLFRQPGRRDKEIVQVSLARVKAYHLSKKQIGELSSGQQQRVFVARALAQEAEILLLDEPLNGLDLPSQEAMFDILDSLRPDGVTVIVATHDLNLAAARFDRILLLNERVVAFGKPTAVLTPDSLLQAYGGHIHIVPNQESASDQMLIADACCDQGHSGAL
ncbi:MAG: metal ABC transporter ATP-binding protein [Chloroflexi bacterium]|nr:metal ABC transporter ATP-binding protein [Chloroflexota bacterium]